MSSQSITNAPHLADSDKLLLSRSHGGAIDTKLMPWSVSFQDMAKELSAPETGTKDGSYFLRCAGTIRNNENTSKTADVLILDADSQITEDGELINGAPNPALVHDALMDCGTNHFIYSSYSNGSKGNDFFKYRVIIPIAYTPEQLPILLDHFHALLFGYGVRLHNVSENRTWSQAWYFARVVSDRKHLFKSFQYFDGSAMNADELCAEYLAENPQTAEPQPVTSNSKHCGGSGGQISPLKMFNLHWGNDPFAYLQTQGYRYKLHKNQARLLHPNSQSKDHGLQYARNCKDGVTRIFSHNGSDPLADGKAHDTFDCYRILEHHGDFNEALKAVGRSFMVNGVTLEKYNQILFRKQKQTAVAGASA